MVKKSTLPKMEESEISHSNMHTKLPKWHFDLGSVGSLEGISLLFLWQNGIFKIMIDQEVQNKIFKRFGYSANLRALHFHDVEISTWKLSTNSQNDKSLSIFNRQVRHVRYKLSTRCRLTILIIGRQSRRKRQIFRKPLDSFKGLPI